MIGILAGMGPKSTGPFINQVVAAFQKRTGAKDDIDFPPMMIYSLPTPFYLDRPIDHMLMQQTICKGLQKLEQIGVTFVAMPCNTAHLYYTELQKCMQIPLLNMIDATLKHVPKSAKKVTVLGTRPTLDSQIYQKELQKAGINFFFKPSWQENVDAMLTQLKSLHHAASLHALWEQLAKSLSEEGIDTILLVCTDLNVIFDSVHSLFQIIDSSFFLA